MEKLIEQMRDIWIETEKARKNRKWIIEEDLSLRQAETQKRDKGKSVRR